MSDVEVVSIAGLDAAIIGTAVVNDCDVLAYDYYAAVAVIIANGFSEEYAEEWIADVASREFDGAPVFVYFDDDQEFYGTSAYPGTTIH